MWLPILIGSTVLAAFCGLLVAMWMQALSMMAKMMVEVARETANAIGTSFRPPTSEIPDQATNLSSQSAFDPPWQMWDDEASQEPETG